MFNLNFRNKDIKIVEKFKIFMGISLLIMLAGIICSVAVGANIGIDFSAGATVKVTVKNIENLDNQQFIKDFDKWFDGDRDLDGTVDSEKIVYKTSPTQVSSASAGVTTFEFRIGTEMSKGGKKVDLTEQKEVGENEFRSLLLLEIEEIETQLRGVVIEYVNNEYITNAEEKLEDNTTFVEIYSHTVDNSIMIKTVQTAVWVLLLGIVAMLIYIGFRFSWITGLSAIVALAHDVVIMVALTTLFQIPINTTFIAAVITIIGYSINSTIVIFDRIRELQNLDSMSNSTDVAVANKAIANTLSRSILTTLTTLVMIVMLAIFGTSSIREFAYPIIFGLIAGAYSSVLLSSSIWVGIRKLAKQANVNPATLKEIKKEKHLAKLAEKRAKKNA